jgi:hypothetical protein
MNPNLPLASSLIALVMSLLVLMQWFRNRKSYQLVWGLSLLLYFVGAGCEFIAGKYGTNLGLFRTWYLTGVFYGGVYLGLGMLYLLMPRKIVNVIMGIVVIASVIAAYAVFTVKLNGTAIQYLSGHFMPDSVSKFTPVFNYFGTVALFGGGLYSLWMFFRTKTLGRRALSNCIIAVASLLPAIGGMEMANGAAPDVFYRLELLAIILFSIGFLVSRDIFSSYRVPLEPAASQAQ